MSLPENTQAIRMVVISGYLIALLCGLYAVFLWVGMITLPTPDHPIQNPWFSAMEVLILFIAPTMVVFTGSLYIWVSESEKAAALLAIVFMSLCAVVTSCVHFSVLTLSRHPAISTTDWAPLVLGFTWPSLAYALDILAWDVFFALGAFFLALSLRGRAKVQTIQRLLMAASATAFLGLAGGGH